MQLFNVYYKLKIYSSAFKYTTTVILHKHKCKDYSDFSAYCLIALLNILKKVLKTIITKHI